MANGSKKLIVSPVGLELEDLGFGFKLNQNTRVLWVGLARVLCHVFQMHLLIIVQKNKNFIAKLKLIYKPKIIRSFGYNLLVCSLKKKVRYF